MTNVDYRFWFETVGTVVVALAVLVLTVRILDKKACLSRYADFQPEYHGMITGCLVQYNGKTVPVEALRVMD